MSIRESIFSMGTRISVRHVDEIDLDDMSFDELQHMQDDLLQKIWMLTLENDVYERYLTRQDPEIPKKIMQILDRTKYARKLSRVMTKRTASRMSFRDSIAFLPDPARRKTLSSRASVYSVLSLVSGSRMGTSSVSTVGKCTEHSKITITHRITMAYKEVEEMTKKLSEEKSLAKKRKAQIRAEIEEVEIRITEVHEAKVEFEENVVVKGVDRITGKIPAEKVTRFIEEWLRSANTIIGRLRLRSSTLKMLIKKTRQQLAQREELGEALRAVDFEQLNIQNKDYIRMIEEKTIYVLDMKRIAGHYHLKLTQHKQKLSDLLCTLNGLKNDISLKQEQINELEDEHKQVETEVAHLNKELEELLHYMDNYTVPDILDFVKLEIQVQELQKKYKLLDRRKNIQKIIFRTSRKQGHNQKSVQDIIMHKKISGTIYPIAPFTVNSLTSHTHTN